VARDTGRTIEDVVVNEQWKRRRKRQPEMSRAEENCLLRDTFPKEFALSDNFEWTYLYIKGVLTVRPTASVKAQAYSAPVTEKRGPLSQWAAFSTRIALTGAFLTIMVSVTNAKLTSDLLSWMRITVPDDARLSVLVLAGFLGLSGFICARMAKRDLALDPTMRGQALRNYGQALGVITALVAAMNFGAINMGFLK
jgi:hypothetical protein